MMIKNFEKRVEIQLTKKLPNLQWKKGNRFVVYQNLGYDKERFAECDKLLCHRIINLMMRDMVIASIKNASIDEVVNSAVNKVAEKLCCSNDEALDILKPSIDEMKYAIA